MLVNNTCVPGNGTECLVPGSAAGLAVGLTLFFLLLVIIAGVTIYKCHDKIRNIGGRSQKKEDHTAPRQTDSHVYTSMIREQSTGHAPIYENLASQTTGRNRPAANKKRSPGEPDEDLYLQCDSPHDGIYSNDPPRSSILPDYGEEDVYIVPDS